jgi:hypothetical protein
MPISIAHARQDQEHDRERVRPDSDVDVPAATAEHTGHRHGAEPGDVGFGLLLSGRIRAVERLPRPVRRG